MAGVAASLLAMSILLGAIAVISYVLKSLL